MTVYRNGFLEGIDAATKLIGIYNGFRDRQTEQEWKQKEWDRRVKLDEREAEQWSQEHGLKKAQLEETIRTHKASEANANARLGLERSKFAYDVQKDKRQAEADALYLQSFTGGDSGITRKDISRFPLAIPGSFDGLGNIAAKVFNAQRPEGSSDNGVFGLLDDRQGNVLVGYVDNVDGQKRVHTDGQPIKREDAIKALKESGASESTIATLLGGEIPVEQPTEAQLNEGIDPTKLEQLQAQKAVNENAQYKNMFGYGVSPKNYDKMVAEERAAIDAKRKENADKFAKTQRDKVEQAHSFADDVTSTYANQRISNEVASTNSKRLQDLVSAYPHASKETRKLIQEEAEALQSGLARELTGRDLVKAYRQQKEVENAQNEGFLSGVKDQSKYRYDVRAENSGDLASSKDIEKYWKGISDGVAKNYGKNESFKKGAVEANAQLVHSYLNDKTGGISRAYINKPSARVQAMKLVKVMTDNNFEDPAAAHYFIQRHGNTGSNLSETEINAISQTFAKAREVTHQYNKQYNKRFTERDVTNILDSVTSIMAKENLGIEKFGSVLEEKLKEYKAR